MRREVVYLSDPLRITCAVLNCVPLPGVGAIIAGVRNPHSPYLRHGILQLLLFVFGAYPLIVPGVIALAWAIWDAVQIGTKGRTPPRWSKPTANAPPESLLPDPEIERARLQAEKQAKREAARKVAAKKQQARQEARAQAKLAKEQLQSKKEAERAMRSAAKAQEKAALAEAKRARK